MGLFIPPNSDRNNNNNNNSAGSKSKESNGEDKTKIIFYSRPSVGLKIWGPLVPAPDYLPGLYGLTAFQTIIGLTMFRHTRLIWHQTTLLARVSKLLSVVTGGYLIFNSGLEISRLILPYDPWYEEAKVARIKAIRNGGKPNFWFGPIDYKPLSFKEWSAKIDTWVEETESQLNSNEPNNFMVQNSQFHSVYQQIKMMNKERNQEILKNLEMPGFKDFLPNLQSFANPEFDRPEFVLPEDNELKDDLDLLEAWEMNDPWKSLGKDTEYEVRFIPKFRWIEKFEETQNLLKEHEKRLKENQGSDVNLIDEHEGKNI